MVTWAFLSANNSSPWWAAFPSCPRCPIVPRYEPRPLATQDIADLRATRIASNSLRNDVLNLQRVVSNAPSAEPESKMWAFAGHQGRRVLVDRREPAKPVLDNPIYTSSSWKIGMRATEVHPVSGQHSYDTGNLYRTVHWKDTGFGLDGRFTDRLADAGMWRHDGLNTNKTRSKAVADPSQWGTPKETLTFGM